MKTRSYSKCFFLSFILLTATYSTVSGQSKASRTETEIGKLIHSVDDERGKETGALIILRDYHVTINKKLQKKTVLRIVGKVYTEKAVNDYSQIPVLFNSYYDQPELDYARVFDASGKEKKIMDDAVQIKTLPSSTGYQYTDTKYLSFAFSGLNIGSVFDFQVTITDKNQIIGGEWFDEHLFSEFLQSLDNGYQSRMDPVVESRYTLSVPKGMNFRYITTKTNYEPVKSSIGENDIYTWDLRDLPAVMIETAMPQLNLVTPELTVTSISSWSVIDRIMTEKIGSATEVKPEILEEALKITRNAGSNDEKIRILYNFIQKGIRYTYADLERGGFAPHPASTVLNSRYGDCKDKTTLFIAMLKALGIEAFPALINPYPQDETTELPVLSFLHMITVIPQEGKDIWLDPTSEVTPFPELPFTDQNRKALIIDSKGGRLVRTPLSLTEDNKCEYQINSYFKGVTLYGDVLIKASGIPGNALKGNLLPSGAENVSQVIKLLANSKFETSVIDTVIFSDIKDPQKPFEMKIFLHIDNAIATDQQSFMIKTIPVFPVSLQLYTSGLTGITGNRKNDLIFPYTDMVIVKEKYAYPAMRLVPVEMPRNDSVNSDYYSFYRSFRRQGDTIFCYRRLISKKLEISHEKLSDFTTGLMRISVESNWSIDLENPAKLAGKILRTSGPEGLLGYSNRLLLKDSANLTGLLLKGAALHEMKKDAPAINSFSSVLRSDPGNKWARFWMSLILYDSGNIEASLINVSEAIKTDPSFEEAYIRRGALFLRLKRYQEGAADFRKAFDLNHGNLDLIVNTANYMGQIKMHKESLELYSAAIKTDSANAKLCCYLADEYTNSGQYLKSVELYKKVIAMDPSFATAIGNLGWSYFMLGDDGKCISFSKQALAIDPKLYYCRYNIALATLRSGDIWKARKLYEEMSKIKEPISYIYREGAIKDLEDLKAKGIFVQEIKAILKEYFGKNY